MEIKGSTTYAAAATSQLAATDKTAESAKQPAVQSSAADSVTISKEAQALLDAEQQYTSTAETTDPVLRTSNSTGGEPEVPPGWPPTNEN